ncbi:MAG: calcium/sodium antiporter [Candidatus Anammoxibacter sp.]
MFFNILIFIAGLALLCYSANWLVKGSSLLAKSYGIKPLIVGLTVVAIGTSAPELVVSVISVIKKSSDIALGNIIGSNICNIGLILGISALICPLAVPSLLLKKELPIMVFTSGLLFFFGSDLLINRIEGVVLLIGMISFMLYLIMSSLKGREKIHLVDINDERGYTGNNINRLKNIALVIVGIGGLVVGSHLMVKSSVFIAKAIGISEFVIGLVVVAIGTSLPELSTSIVAALRKETDILVGNVIGSNISNVLLVIGTVAIINPLSVDRSILSFEFPVMMIFSVALFPFLCFKSIMQKVSGIVLVLGYAFIVVISFI